MHRAGYEAAFIGKGHMGIDDPPRPGFDRWISFKGPGTYSNPDLNIDGKPGKESGYVTDVFTDYAVNFLKARHEKPFLLFRAHKAVHPELVQ
jgi:N-acetylglucosamine-6-sulfatase